MTVGSRALVVTSLAAAALALAAPSFADRGKSSSSGKGVGTSITTQNATVAVQGVVQSVSGSTVTVKQLDGSTVSVGLGKSTHITVDGHPGKISDVKPGFVLVTTVKAGQPASTLRFLRSS
jgi:hypothetical protein